MNNKVKACADASSAVVIPSKNNPEYGYIRVEQKRITIDANGFAKARTMSALIPGKVVDLKAFGWTPNQEVPGKVIFKEQLTPFNLDEPERNYKFAGETGIVCKIEGAPIYRKTFYSQDSEDKDVYIRDENGEIMSHDNTDEIKAAYASSKEDNAVAAAEGNDLQEG